MPLEVFDLFREMWYCKSKETANGERNVTTSIMLRRS